MAESLAQIVVDHDFPRKFREREPAALRAVARLYLRQIFRAARGAGLDTERAQDVTQEVFATLIETAPRFEGRSHIRTWLFGILYRKIAEGRRKIVRDARTDDIDACVESRFDPDGTWLRPPGDIDAGLRSAEIREALADCMEAVPTAQRMAFILREAEGLSTAEICKILDVSRTNFGVLLYRARNRLRECLEAKQVRETS